MIPGIGYFFVMEIVFLVFCTENTVISISFSEEYGTNFGNLNVDSMRSKKFSHL